MNYTKEEFIEETFHIDHIKFEVRLHKKIV